MFLGCVLRGQQQLF